MVPGDEDLLVLGVPVELDQLHPVEQRAWDRLEHVGRGQEHHVGQVELDLEVVVAERVVLRRVEHLEQRRRRVTAVVRADLVHLVEQHDRVHRARLADGADDPAGQRPDVGPPVPPDLRLVPDAAQGDPDELAAHGPRDRLAKRGLADAGRADQGEHGAGTPPADDPQAPVGAALAHRQVLDDALLDVIEPGVVLVQDAPGVGDVVGVLGPLVPRDVEDGVQPGADPAGLGRGVRSALQLVDLLQRGVLDRLRQVGRFHPGPVVVLLGGRVAVQVGEFLADGRELLAEQEFLLLLLHALGDVLADGLGHLELGQLLLGPADHELQALDQVSGLEQLQLLRGREVAGVARAVRDRGRVGELLNRVDDLPGAALLQHAGDQGLVLLGQFVGPRAAAGLLDHGALHPQRRAGTRGPRADPDPGRAAHHRAGLPAGQPPDLLDHGERADARQPAVGQPRHEQHPRLDLRTHAGNLPGRHPGRVDGGANFRL